MTDKEGKKREQEAKKAARAQERERRERVRRIDQAGKATQSGPSRSLTGRAAEIVGEMGREASQIYNEGGRSYDRPNTIVQKARRGGPTGLMLTPLQQRRETLRDILWDQRNPIRELGTPQEQVAARPLHEEAQNLLTSAKQKRSQIKAAIAPLKKARKIQENVLLRQPGWSEHLSTDDFVDRLRELDTILGSSPCDGSR